MIARSHGMRVGATSAFRAPDERDRSINSVDSGKWNLVTIASDLRKAVTRLYEYAVLPW